MRRSADQHTICTQAHALLREILNLCTDTACKASPIPDHTNCSVDSMITRPCHEPPPPPLPRPQPPLKTRPPPTIPSPPALLYRALLLIADDHQKLTLPKAAHSKGKHDSSSQVTLVLNKLASACGMVFTQAAAAPALFMSNRSALCPQPQLAPHHRHHHPPALFHRALILIPHDHKRLTLFEVALS